MAASARALLGIPNRPLSTLPYGRTSSTRARMSAAWDLQSDLPAHETPIKAGGVTRHKRKNQNPKSIQARQGCPWSTDSFYPSSKLFFMSCFNAGSISLLHYSHPTNRPLVECLIMHVHLFPRNCSKTIQHITLLVSFPSSLPCCQTAI